MGCDIHIVLERKDKDNDRWVGLRQLSYIDVGPLDLSGAVMPNEARYICWKIARRDYAFFYRLAGVRGYDEPVPMQPLSERGLPDDMSHLSSFVLGSDSDLHSHSWVDMRELIPILLHIKEDAAVPDLVATKLEDSEPDISVLHRWVSDDIEIEHIDDWRLVFAFDN
jgi:hypothetical protein